MLIAMSEVHKDVLKERMVCSVVDANPLLSAVPPTFLSAYPQALAIQVHCMRCIFLIHTSAAKVGVT